MSPTSKRKLHLNTLSLKLFCGSCTKPSLSSISSPKYYKRHNLSYSSSTSSSSSAATASWAGPVKSVAVQKDSNDPYLDFRQSMLHMIMENELYSKEELKELLNCFLQLNSPSLHGTIFRAFTEIWNGFFFPAPPGSTRPRFRPKYYEI